MHLCTHFHRVHAMNRIVHLLIHPNRESQTFSKVPTDSTASAVRVPFVSIFADLALSVVKMLAIMMSTWYISLGLMMPSVFHMFIDHLGRLFHECLV